MNRIYKPDQYPSVSAYIMANGVPAVIEFLKKTFNAEPMRGFHAADGTVMHAELLIDDTVVMIAEANSDFPAFPIWLHVYVPDVDATYQQALDAGGISVQEPSQKANDPDRRGAVRDPAGNIWWIATQIG